MADIKDIKEWLTNNLNMETYDVDVDEFVDWITGIDSFTGRNVTGGKPVSGRAIRKLIQDRLRKPITVYNDPKGLYRLFPSQSAMNKYVNAHNTELATYDAEEAKATEDLEIFNFERPSEYFLTIEGVEQAPRYAIKGDKEADAVKLKFRVELKNNKGNFKDESFTINYSITNNITGITQEFPGIYGANKINNVDTEGYIEVNLYDYLKEGVNSIKLKIKTDATGVSTEIGFPLYFIDFTLSSGFKYYQAQVKDENIEVPFTVERSTNIQGSTLVVKAYVDGALVSTFSEAVVSPQYSGTLEFPNIYDAATTNEAVVHSLRLEGQMVQGTTTFYSNVIYQTFVVGSDVQGITTHAINISTSVPYRQLSMENNKVLLHGTQYSKFTMNWAYYTDQTVNKDITVNWAIGHFENDEFVQDVAIANMAANFQVDNTLVFIPEISCTRKDNKYLVVLYDGVILDKWQIIIDESSILVHEQKGYSLKLNAFGKTNSDPDKDVWIDAAHNIDVDFHNVSWDNTSGWDNNSLLLIGDNSWADINYNVFNSSNNGKTIEIDFSTEQVFSDDEVLMNIGDPSKGHIEVTAVKASVKDGNTNIVSIHYKANERNKLSFIFNPTGDTVDSSLVFITCNGVLERAAGINFDRFKIATADVPYIPNKFRVGAAKGGIRLYMVRGYNTAIPYNTPLDNYIYDSDNKVEIFNRNNILSAGSIVYEKCKELIDTILIEGDLTEILKPLNTKKDSETTVKITRSCPYDTTKNFTVVNGMARKHGQSTLQYPVPSLKIWLNKAKEPNLSTILTLSTTQEALELNKNRYCMKTTSIPANKFVLQANYADSSGANNGSLQRLIQETWYNAQIKGEYRLRTAPQLFSSGEVIHHNDTHLNEVDEDAWIEGYGCGEAENKTWKQIAQKDFPYQIRVAPDSFPCVVFTRDNSESSYKFLGQYVFMDDKKSDFLYGERSIYHHDDEKDPFCLKIANKSKDKNDYKVWDNSNVLRIEGILADDSLSSFLDYNMQATENDPINSGTVSCETVKYDEGRNPVGYYWETNFEMIYPDPDDLCTVDGVEDKSLKFAQNSKFVQKAQPWLQFLQWITGIAQMNKQAIRQGMPYVEGSTRITQVALDEFKRTAHDHIDFYKLAAYYIFFLRFGLTDSVERNAQWKTYDGQHWHCESWDMDIAVGNKNDGGITFDPPMNRDTRMPDDANKYAFTGRSTLTSNTLWDCLEAWDYWMKTIVKDTADALFAAGLKYSNIVKYFDKEYCDKWSEIMYNISGHFKYVERRGNTNTWLLWLQGSSISHRHWWLSKSMNYYDAMWGVGDFDNHAIYLAVTKLTSPTPEIVSIYPTESTFFEMTRQDRTISLGVKGASKDTPAEWDFSSIPMTMKDSTHILGATFIEKLDLSCFATGLNKLELQEAYDEVLGASLKELYVGTKLNEVVGNENMLTGVVSGASFSPTTDSLVEENGVTVTRDALASIRILDITGQQNVTDTSDLIYKSNRRALHTFRAIGTGINYFYSSKSGNRFIELKLPSRTIKNGVETSKLVTFHMENSTWEDLSFWRADVDTSAQVQYVEVTDPVTGEVTREAVPTANTAVFTNEGIPYTIESVKFVGSTASNECSADFIRDWFTSIENHVRSLPVNSGKTEAQIEEAILTELHSYSLTAENINWGGGNTKFYYKDLRRLAALFDKDTRNLKGYIIISDNSPLDSTQLAELRDWFGDGIFNKSNRNSSLVIDHEYSGAYVQINVGGDSYPDTVNGVTGIYVREGGTITLQATKFLLGDDDNEYAWSIDKSNPAGNIGEIVVGNDNIARLTIHPSTAGDYNLTITAGVVGEATTQSVTVHVIAVTYPEDWVIRAASKSGQDVRTFTASSTVMAKIFGSDRFQFGSAELRSVFAIYGTYQEFEFYVEPINAEGTTATIGAVTASVNGVDTHHAMNTTNVTAFRGDGSLINPIAVGEEYLYTKNSATSSRNGIVLASRDTLPADITRYVLTFNISIGGTTVTRYANILVINDSNPVVSRVGDKVNLYEAIREYFNVNMQRPFYKLDLLGIDGTLDWHGKQLTSLLTDTVDGGVHSIFKYLPNVQHLNLAGAAFEMYNNLILGDNKSTLNFVNMTDLEDITFAGASATLGTNDNAAYTIDVSANSKLTSFIATGTNIGIKADYTGVNSLLQTIQLGTPYEVYLKDTNNLDTCTATSNTNLTDIYIENVNVSSLKGFNIFDNIYNTTT